MRLNKLTLEEKRVIQEKGTEAPFTGMYEKHKETGVYVCRQCNAYLYRSTYKFESNCGWPSFDEEIVGSVKKALDADKRRTEITCARCSGHLGHVFEGEKLTDKNIRHCVNSVSMKFIDQKDVVTDSSIYLGGGCFWCIEAFLNILPGVESVVSGYAGGDKKNPTYDDVCSGKTGHAEVVRVIFSPVQISLEKILKIFFLSHNPTTLNRQGGDIGTQYRSIILCDSLMQKEIVEKFIQKIMFNFTDVIVTEVKMLNVFYKAESYHQNYFKNNPEKAYCQVIIAPKIEKIKNNFK